MDHDRDTERHRFLPQIRHSLSADSLLQLENVETIELTTGISRPDGRTDSQDLERPVQDGQAHLDQAKATDAQTQQSQAFGDLGGERTQSHQVASEDEPLQQGRVFNDVEDQQTQQDRPHGNDSTEPASKSLIETRKRRRYGGLFRDWTWEMVSMLVAIGCLIAIFVILAKSDDQEQPKWPYASTLNLSTLIALIATILRLMLGNVLGAGE